MFAPALYDDGEGSVLACDATSLQCHVVDRLAEVARSVRIAEYVSAYPPRGTHITTKDAVAAVRGTRAVVSLAVVDASVLAVFYAVDDSRHVLVAERLKVGDALFAPAHLDAEIVSALRGMARCTFNLIN
jgi:hypothetical protein